MVHSAHINEEPHLSCWFKKKSLIVNSILDLVAGGCSFFYICGILSLYFCPRAYASFDNKFVALVDLDIMENDTISRTSSVWGACIWRVWLTFFYFFVGIFVQYLITIMIIVYYIRLKCILKFMFAIMRNDTNMRKMLPLNNTSILMQNVWKDN